MLRACKICGKWFNSTSKNNTLCSLECRDISRHENRKYNKSKPKKKESKNAEKIIDINAEAKAMGMSYGRYVAYMSMKEGK